MRNNLINRFKKLTINLIDLNKLFKLKHYKLKLDWIKIGKLILALAIAGSIVGIRQLGLLQYGEWLGIDLMFQLRPPEPIDERIVIIGFDNEDMRKLGDSRLKDGQIAQLIRKIKEGEPRAIGLDIFRDHPIPPGHEELIEVFTQTPYLFGVGKQTGIEGDPDFDIIAPPPFLKKPQIADVSVTLDGDEVMRRGFFYPVTEKKIVPSLGLAMAFKYLKFEKIFPEESRKKRGFFNLGETTFYSFEKKTGPYVSAEDGSYQTLMNWRKANSNKSSFKVVSVFSVLDGSVSPYIFKERAVFIGGFAPKLGDQFLSPFSRRIFDSPRRVYGVELQAQLFSQVVSAVLDKRPLVKVWTADVIALSTIILGIITHISLVFFYRQWLKILLFLLGSSSVLIIVCYIFFLSSYWLPLIPSLVTIWAVGISLAIFDYESGRIIDYKTIQELNQKLKRKLDERQIYKETSVLINRFSETIIEPLEYFLDLPKFLGLKPPPSRGTLY